jgi:hypothetical protein
MTTNPTPPELRAMSEAEVTQADRDAAAALCRETDQAWIAEGIEAGTRDRFAWVQAFARHRIQAEARGREMVELGLSWMNALTEGTNIPAHVQRIAEADKVKFATFLAKLENGNG